MSDQATPLTQKHVGFTPAPWIVDECEDGTIRVAKDLGNDMVMVLAGDRANFDRARPEDVANCRLMASAPTLYDSLVKAEQFIASFENNAADEGLAPLLAGIRAALALWVGEDAAA